MPSLFRKQSGALLYKASQASLMYANECCCGQECDQEAIQYTVVVGGLVDKPSVIRGGPVSSSGSDPDNREVCLRNSGQERFYSSQQGSDVNGAHFLTPGLGAWTASGSISTWRHIFPSTNINPITPTDSFGVNLFIDGDICSTSGETIDISVDVRFGIQGASRRGVKWTKTINQPSGASLFEAGSVSLDLLNGEDAQGDIWWGLRDIALNANCGHSGEASDLLDNPTCVLSWSA